MIGRRQAAAFFNVQVNYRAFCKAFLRCECDRGLPILNSLPCTVGRGGTRIQGDGSVPRATASTVAMNS